MGTAIECSNSYCQITVANIAPPKAVLSTVKTFVGKVFCIIVIDANLMYVSMYIIWS